MDKADKYLRWWLVYTQPLPSWEADDIEEMRELIARSPPNKSIEHPSIVGFLAGYFQAVGDLGYLEVITPDERIHVPYVQVVGEKEVIDRIVRLLGDVQEREKKGDVVRAIFTGLRAIIFLRIISPFLMGSIREAAEEIIQYGYKITNTRKAEDLFKKLQIKNIEEIRRRPVKILKKTCLRK